MQLTHCPPRPPNKRGPKPRTLEQVIKDFWKRVKKTKTCWLWTGGKDAAGYGILNASALGKLPITAHVLSFAIHKKKPVPKGLFVCHTCDVNACVRPAHLFLGTHLDNMRDRDQKGRVASGTANGQAKLSARQVRAVRKEYAKGIESQASIGKRFGITNSSVCNIVNRKSYREVI